MQLEMAKEIARIAYRHRLIEAIKLLRHETAMGLLEAKNYIQLCCNEQTLLAKLCEDFVKDKKDILAEIVVQRNRLNTLIERLEFEIAEEEKK